MDEAEADVLVLMGLPRAHCAQLASTHTLARLSKKIERQASGVSARTTLRPNDASLERLIDAMLRLQTDACQAGRRYMHLEAIEAVHTGAEHAGVIEDDAA